MHDPMNHADLVISGCLLTQYLNQPPYFTPPDWVRWMEWYSGLVNYPFKVYFEVGMIVIKV